MNEVRFSEPGDELAILTERLELRDFRGSDLADVYAFRSDPEVTRFMEFIPETWPETRTWLDKVIFHNRERPRVAYNLAIVTRTENRVIGWIGFGDSERHPGKDELGFGYALHRVCWGRGYAAEAVKAVVGFGFQQLGRRRASAWCYAENRASARVLDKAGLRLERRFVKTEPVSGETKECLEYAIHAEEWDAGTAVRPG
jgi:RimJ/RimL family protein N-acetyltransferase